MGIILLLFIGTPIVEIAVFIGVGGEIGVWWTLLLIVATAVAGTTILRRQGLATLRRARESVARNEFPVNEVFDGACLLVAGLLLLTPGFVTDFVGALLLIPPFRALIRGPTVRYFLSRAGIWTPGHDDGQTIDGDFDEIRPAEDDDDDDGPAIPLGPPDKTE